MKIYISGSISNNPNYKEDFERAEKKLISDGYEVINPTMIELPMSCSHADYMKIDFVLLDLADGIYLLSNYEKSKGACMEYGYALAKDKIIFFESEQALKQRGERNNEYTRSN